MNKAKRAVSILLLLIFCLGIATSSAFATPGGAIAGEEANTSKDVDKVEKDLGGEGLLDKNYINFEGVKAEDVIANIKIAQPHYRLDTTAGITDVGDNIANTLSNFFLSMTSGFAKFTAIIAQTAHDFDLAKKIGNSFDGLFSGLKPLTETSSPIVMVGLALMLGAAAIALARGNIAGSLGNLGKVILILAIIGLFFAYGPTTLMKNMNDMTNAVNAEILKTANEQTKLTGKTTAGNECASIAWNAMVDYPWQMLEGGDSYMNRTPMISQKQSMITQARAFDRNKEEGTKWITRVFVLKSSKEREDKLNSTPEGKDKAIKEVLTNTDAEQGGAWGQFADTLALSLLNLLLGLTLGIVSVALIVMQFVAFILLLIAPIALALAMAPGYGIETVRKWATTFVFVFLAKVIISFMLTILFIFVSWGYTTLLVKEKSLFLVFVTMLGIIFAMYFARGFIADIFSFNKIQKMRSGDPSKKISGAMARREGANGVNGGGAFRRAARRVPYVGGAVMAGEAVGRTANRQMNKIPAVQKRKQDAALKKNLAKNEAALREKGRLKNREDGQGFIASKLDSKAERKLNRADSELMGKNFAERRAIRKGEKEGIRMGREDFLKNESELAKKTAASNDLLKEMKQQDLGEDAMKRSARAKQTGIKDIGAQEQQLNDQYKGMGIMSRGGGQNAVESKEPPKTSEGVKTPNRSEAVAPRSNSQTTVESKEPPKPSESVRTTRAQNVSEAPKAETPVAAASKAQKPSSEKVGKTIGKKQTTTYKATEQAASKQKTIKKKKTIYPTKRNR